MIEIVCFNCRYVTEKLIENRSKSSLCSEKTHNFCNNYRKSLQPICYALVLG
jgi:hypothetical protein